MQRKSISRLCMFFVLAATAAFTLGGCSDGNDGAAGKDGADLTTGTVAASTFTADDLQKNVIPAVKILSVSIPGPNPVVEVQVTDKTTGRGISGLRTFGLHIAKLVPAANGSSSYWVNYLDRGISLPAPLAFATTADKKQVTGTIGKPFADPGKTLVAANAVGIDFTKNPVGSVLIPGYTVVDKGNGTYSLTFYSDITSNPNAPYDANATHRVGVTVTSVAAPGVTATGPIDPATGSVVTTFAANNRAAEVYDFIPKTGKLTDAAGNQIFARNLVPTSACNGCHTNIASILGHTARPNVLLCDICHTPANTSGEGDMVTLMHRIHMGKDLPVAVQAENVLYPDKLAPRTAVLVPYGDFTFPMDIRNCTVCHQGPEADAWKTSTNRKNCASCHNNVDFVVGTNHNTGGAPGAQADDNQCILCHSDAPVSAVHTTDYSTPNNRATSAGLVNFKYDLKSVAVDATTNVATITFRILSDKGTGAAMAPVIFTGAGSSANTPAADAVLAGFSGSPGFILAYNKSTANQTFTTSPDYNNLGVKAAQPISISIAALLNSAKGTLSAPDADGYYTASIPADSAIAPTAPTSFPVGAKMRTVALQGYFTQVDKNSGRHTISVVKTANGDTARRVVIDSGKCGACHEVFEGHGGNRNIGKDTVGEAVCTLCHVPNLSSSGRTLNLAGLTADQLAQLTTAGYSITDTLTYNEESNNFKDMIHGIHAGNNAVHVTPLKFVRGDRFAIINATWSFPAILKNCEACHTTTSYRTIPANAMITTNKTSDGTDATVAAVTAARVSLPNITDLVTTPFTAACVSCHQLASTQAHMVQNGGKIKVPRFSSLGIEEKGADEACATCHGASGTASIYNSHRF